MFGALSNDFNTMLSPNKVNTLNFACRYYACLCGHEDVVKYLLDNGKSKITPIPTRHINLHAKSQGTHTSYFNDIRGR